MKTLLVLVWGHILAASETSDEWVEIYNSRDGSLENLDADILMKHRTANGDFWYEIMQVLLF